MPLSPLTFGAIKVRTPVCAPGQRIGIMGGSFNPPHDGHRLVAEAALQRLGLDRLWVVVTPGNPLKEKAGLPPQSVRMAAAEKKLRHPRIDVTGFEAALGSPYTAVTVAFLKRRYPGVRFVWVMGADNLAEFHRWQDWRRIASAVPIAVIDRPNHRWPALASPAAHALARRRRTAAAAPRLPFATPPAWTVLTNRLSSVSSTKIRRQRADT